MATALTYERITPDAEGLAHAPDGPGLGMTPDPGTVRRYLVDLRIDADGMARFRSPAAILCMP